MTHSRFLHKYAHLKILMLGPFFPLMALLTVIQWQQPAPAVCTGVTVSAGFTCQVFVDPAGITSTFPPTGMTFDSSGSLYYTTFSNATIKVVDSAGMLLTTIARSGTTPFPWDVIFDGAGTLYLSDVNANTSSGPFDGAVFRDPAGSNTVIAQGFPNKASIPTGDPGGMALPSGNNLLAGFSNGLYVSTFAPGPTLTGPGGGGSSGIFLIANPSGLASVSVFLDTAAVQANPIRDAMALAFGPGGAFGDDLYVTDSNICEFGSPACNPASSPTINDGAIYRLDSSAAATLFAGGIGGVLESPWDLVFSTVDAFGPDLYITDLSTGKVVSIDSSGSISDFASGLTFPGALTFGPDECLYVSEAGGAGNANRIVRFCSDNQPPTVDAGGPYEVDEGSLVTLLASGSDPDGDPLSYSWTVDSTLCTFDDASSVSPSLTCDDNGGYIVTVLVDDSQATASSSATVTVNNVAPTATFGNDAPVDEGTSFTLSLSGASDPSASDEASGFTYSFDCGDGGSYSAFSPSSSGNCAAPDNGLRVVGGRIRDKDGGISEYNASAVIANVAPTVGPITAPVDPVMVDSGINASADFTDPGLLDTHTAIWDWGDGSSPGTVTEADGSGSVSDTHVYTSAGVYVITLTVEDKDGDVGESIYQFVVVYDPDGGFVTGGGWIWSQAGWCQLDAVCAGAEGKANFGFVSKYKKGATVPSGNTQFNFSAGGLNFYSADYDWLVVTGGNYARFKGSGTINGSNAPNGALYKFQIWAGDGTGGGGADTFRIKIWYEENGTEIVVYDNGMHQPIGGGNIKVHN